MTKSRSGRPLPSLGPKLMESCGRFIFRKPHLITRGCSKASPQNESPCSSPFVPINFGHCSKALPLEPVPPVSRFSLLQLAARPAFVLRFTHPRKNLASKVSSKNRPSFLSKTTPSRTYTRLLAPAYFASAFSLSLSSAVRLLSLSLSLSPLAIAVPVAVRCRCLCCRSPLPSMLPFAVALPVVICCRCPLSPLAVSVSGVAVPIAVP